MSNDTPTDIQIRFQRLVQAGIQVSAEHSLQQVLKTVAESLRGVIDARYSAIGILDESGERLTDFETSGISQETVDKIGDFPTGAGVLGTLIRHPVPLRIARISDHTDSVGFPPDHPEMSSFLGVPVMGRDGPIGNLYLTEKTGGGEFTEEDESIAVMFAAQVAVAVDNARLYEGTNQLLKEISDLHTSREQFFATINHELRNALTAVHGWSDLLLRKLGPSAPNAAREVYESAEDTLELLDDLLLLNRIHQGRVVPTAREFDCRDRMESVRSVLSETAREKEVSIQLTSADEAVNCVSDPKRIDQLLTNLLAYAVRHCPDGDTVGMKLTATAEEFRVDVTYGGPEIAPEIQKILFEQYVQGDTSRERGTGLGLPLAQSLARLLGGDVHVESQRETGTRFWTSLPLHLPLH